MRMPVGYLNPIISIILIVFIHFTTTISAWDVLKLWTYECSLFPSTTSYESNLSDTLSSILSDTNFINKRNGFYNFSTGQDSNKASAIGLCRGDVNHTSCKACLNDVVNALQIKCPMNKEAIGWEDQCMLRYSNRSIFNHMETSPMLGMYSMANLSNTDVTPFNDKRDKLLANLQKKATSGNPPSYFETGKDEVTDNLKVYAMVQCTPDISGSLCSQCLHLAIKNISIVFNVNTRGGRVLMPSCNLRFEVDPFYSNSTSSTPSKVGPASPPASSSVTASPSSTVYAPASSAMRGRGNSESQKFVLTVAFIVVVASTILGLPSVY